MQTLTITRPDDWHLHVRDGDVLKDLLADTSARFARAIIMPNLKPPVTSVDQALAYRERILKSLPQGSDFIPLMTLYLTDNTSPDELQKAKESGHIYAVKYYPAGATTNSDSGVTDVAKTYDALEKLSELGMPLLVHGEVTDKNVDVFDREKVFIDNVLKPVTEKFPELKVVLEHVTTEDAVNFVGSASDNVAATITPHHLLYNRNAMFQGGIRPHYYCLPILKREQHRNALLAAETSGNPKFFLGTDSAPHARNAKETACGCAGIYSAHAAIELYTEAFESANALDKLEAFASFYGADFYGLARNTDQITLTKKTWQVPDSKSMGSDTLIPLKAGSEINWQLVDAGLLFLAAAAAWVPLILCQIAVEAREPGAQCALLAGFHVEGEENIPPEGPFILALNEYSPVAMLVSGWISIVLLIVLDSTADNVRRVIFQSEKARDVLTSASQPMTAHDST